MNLTATEAEIAAAIRAVQARARARLCMDPEALARRVRAHIELVNQVAAGLCLDLDGLHARGAWWEPLRGSYEQDQTVVVLYHGKIEVVRAPPGGGTANGKISMILDERVPR